MDNQEQTVSIPIQEYENYRNILALQDKQSIIRDLQKLLLNKDEDLRRYKDKCEQQESVLQRTQKTLDKCIQNEQSHTSIPLKTSLNRQHRSIVQLKRSVSKPKSTTPGSGAVEMVSRAVDEPATTPASLPDQTSRPGLIEDSSAIKSLPLALGTGSPGMSTALLKRLVQENLKLKAQVDKRHPGRSKTNEDSDKIIDDLNAKLNRKQQLVDDLLNQGGGKGEAAARLEALHKENSDYMDAIEMNKIVINSLKQDNMLYKQDKEEMESLLSQYRPYKTVAEETGKKVANLEAKLKEEVERRKLAESQVDSIRNEVEKLKLALEKAEEDRELAVKNYNTLSSHYHTSQEKNTASQPAYMNLAPQLSATGVFRSPSQSQPSSLTSPQAYNISQSMYAGDTQRIHARSTAVMGPPKSPQSPLIRKHVEGSPGYVPSPIFPQPLQESSSSGRMTQSVYVAPTFKSQSPQSPLPTERKTFKCPRCDMKFNILQGYRDHIKVCLKN